jgi:hypothetical protein
MVDIVICCPFFYLSTLIHSHDLSWPSLFLSSTCRCIKWSKWHWSWGFNMTLWYDLRSFDPNCRSTSCFSSLLLSSNLTASYIGKILPWNPEFWINCILDLVLSPIFWFILPALDLVLLETSTLDFLDICLGWFLLCIVAPGIVSSFSKISCVSVLNVTRLFLCNGSAAYLKTLLCNTALKSFFKILNFKASPTLSAKPTKNSGLSFSVVSGKLATGSKYRTGSNQ